jgi:alpha-glucan,water dikinase
MHRFNKAADILGAGMPPNMDPADVAARLYVWLRYSAIRQLTWQRNYNTQPRILGEAQARLTNAVAAVRALPTPPHPQPPSISTDE